MELIFLIIFVQIFFESFPVSSSGHVELVKKIFAKSSNSIPNFFDHFLHGPTLFILMILFFKEWFYPCKKLIKGIFNKKFSQKDSYKSLLKIFFKICSYLLITTLFALFGWFFVQTKLNKIDLFAANISLLIGFFITMTFLFSLLLQKYLYKHFYKYQRVFFKIHKGLTIEKVVIIALVQMLALVPGISRFAVVYCTSRLLKVPSRRAFQFTFLIQIPLIVPAFFLGFIKLISFQNFEKYFNFSVFVTILISTFFAYFGLLWMQKLSQKNKIGFLGFYLFVPIGILVWLILA
ncbi:hypothetical protein GF322_01985 [Candidatus Dependentiae bacterium]|nr:hypothetical protein [Candidatus Dependentiae bacterium]